MCLVCIYHILYLVSPVQVLNATNKVNNNNETNSNNFKGIVVAAVNGNTTANILKSQLLPQFNGTVKLLDNDGIILHASNRSLIGKNIFGTEFQSIISALLPNSSKNLFNKLINASLQPSNNGGMRDIYIQGKTHTIAYEPVTLQGRHFLTIYVDAPHNLANNVAIAIAQQKNLSTIIIMAIGIVAFVAAFLVLNWNKKLEGTVNARTEDLRRANEQLKNQDEMQREFINVAAHELRTPIQPILGLADVLKSEIKDKGQIRIIRRYSQKCKTISETLSGHT